MSEETRFTGDLDLLYVDGNRWFACPRGWKSVPIPADLGREIWRTAKKEGLAAGKADDYYLFYHLHPGNGLARFLPPDTELVEAEPLGVPSTVRVARYKVADVRL